MQKSFHSLSSYTLFGLLFIGILKVSGASNQLYAFAHTIDMHARGDILENLEKEKKEKKEKKEREEREKKDREEKEKREREERENKK